MTQSFLIGLCVLGLALLGTTETRAQDVDELRQELAGLPAAPLPRDRWPAAVTSVEYLLDVAERIERGFPTQSAHWRSVAQQDLHALREGRDPYIERRGQISFRGYRSAISQTRQGYSVYIPPDYDPSRRYPLLVMLHGGSSNGNLFLGVVLGNNMDWETYSQHLWDEFTPRWSPDWIIVAPDGFGQVLWRWMGEQDVLDVIDDVQAQYSVDVDRVVLCGLSNGGVGAYSIGMRHASRFSMVLAIAGAPSWLQYTGGLITPAERTALTTHSGIHLIENSIDTNFHFYHGLRDRGPMRPAYVTELEDHMRSIGLQPQSHWFDFGHDLLYLVHRHGRSYESWASAVRNPSPERVVVVSGDYRANRQHWVTLSRIEDYPRLARAEAIATDGQIEIQTERVREIELDAARAPTGTSERVRVVIDGAIVCDLPRGRVPQTMRFARIDAEWREGRLPDTQGLEKRPGISGPLTDPYRDGMVHVYGTQDPDAADALRAAAERGARGWPLWLWNHSQPVVADTEVTPELMARSHLVLYGIPGSNSVLERIAEQLPIRVTEDAVVVGETSHRRPGIGTRFVYPNPLQPSRYVIVQAAPTLDAVARGHNLPDWLPDWVVYDASATASRPRLVSARHRQIAQGFFNDSWQLRPLQANAVRGGDEGVVVVPDLRTAANGSDLREAGDSVRTELNALIGAPADFVIPDAVLAQTPEPRLEPAHAPRAPRGVTHFLAPAEDPAGAIARAIARIVPTFLNYRAIIPGGQWRVRDEAVWDIRPQSECYDTLERLEIPHEIPDETPNLVPSPVIVTGPIHGVSFRMLRPEQGPLLVSCELALRMVTVANVVHRHGIVAIDVLSAYRDAPAQSFHRMGLALDLFGFERSNGTLLTVFDDFRETPGRRTCVGRAPSGAPGILRDIACGLWQSMQFSSVLTPNYNDGHRNHIHLDARPHDPRFFVR